MATETPLPPLDERHRRHIVRSSVHRLLAAMDSNDEAVWAQLVDVDMPAGPGLYSLEQALSMLLIGEPWASDVSLNVPDWSRLNLIRIAENLPTMTRALAHVIDDAAVNARAGGDAFHKRLAAATPGPRGRPTAKDHLPGLWLRHPRGYSVILTKGRMELLERAGRQVARRRWRRRD